MKKIYLILMLVLIFITSISLTANDDLTNNNIDLYNESYENEIINTVLDEKNINYYSEYIKINDNGFYEVDDSLYYNSNQNLVEITNNIKLINELIKENLAYIDEEKEIIIRSDEIKTLFGYNFKLNWYGINATLDKTGMAFFGFLGIMKHLKTGFNVLKMFSKNKIEKNLIDIQGFILKNSGIFLTHIYSQLQKIWKII